MGLISWSAQKTKPWLSFWCHLARISLVRPCLLLIMLVFTQICSIESKPARFLVGLLIIPFHFPEYVLISTILDIIASKRPGWKPTLARDFVFKDRPTLLSWGSMGTIVIYFFILDIMCPNWNSERNSI